MGCALKPVASTPATARSLAGVSLWQDARIFEAVQDLLRSARVRVWVEMYEFDRPDLEAQLVTARARGRDVRVIIDPSVTARAATARRLSAFGVADRSYPLDD